MKRGLIILVLGLAGAFLAYCCVYMLGTAAPRALLQNPQPELAWLQQEFQLGEAEFQRIVELHDGYLPQCMERCRRIEELNVQLSRALDQADEVSPEIERLLSERAQMRADCQAGMLKHFFEVSRSMPIEQGRRYLAWARENTCLLEPAMDHDLDHDGEGHAPASLP